MEKTRNSESRPNSLKQGKVETEQENQKTPETAATPPAASDLKKSDLKKEEDFVADPEGARRHGETSAA